jgi:hypothetical protein
MTLRAINTTASKAMRRKEPDCSAKKVDQDNRQQKAEQEREIENFRQQNVRL